MTNVHVKLIIGGLVLGVAVGYLGYAGINAGKSIYLSVDAYTASQEYRDVRVQLHGHVGSEDFLPGADGLNVQFVLLGKTSKIPVRYEGVVPDLFKIGGEVVVLGRIGKDDVFEATELMTKCASKYDEMESKGKKRP
jgi:cytochrome c-type biogenesis protein CcmE